MLSPASSVGDQNIKSAKIWTNGRLSDRLKAELDRRSIAFQSLSVRQEEPHG
jgi:hypothetical protein